MSTTDVAPEIGRHRVVTALLLVHIPVFAVLGFREGWTMLHVVAEVLVPLGAMWAVARFEQRPRLARGAGGIGLMYASAVLVHVTGGVTEAHFYFFVAFGLVALYRDWAVFFAAAAFAVGHHAFFALTGGELFRQAYQVEQPLLWATVHVSFVAIVTAVQAVGMYDVARSVRARTQLETQIARSEERRMTALTVHDEVVQALATANYARSMGEDELATRSLESAMRSSRQLVTELLADSSLDERILVRPQPVGQDA